MARKKKEVEVKEEEKLERGRPPIYNESFVDRARDYLENLPEDEVLHSIEGLSSYLDIARSTVYKWIGEEGKENFSDIVEKTLNKQGKTLINNGVSGKFNASITKVILTKHGYREGIDTTTNDKDLPTPIYGGQSTSQGHEGDEEDISAS